MKSNDIACYYKFCEVRAAKGVLTGFFILIRNKMVAQYLVNGKEAVKIFAVKVRDFEKATLFNCEGDKVWFPKSCVKIVDAKTILVQEWIYKQKFPTK